MILTALFFVFKDPLNQLRVLQPQLLIFILPSSYSYLLYYLLYLFLSSYILMH